MAGQCYAIDWFLWFMAQHGWTLQRSRAKGVEFFDLSERCAEMRNADAEAFRAALDTRLAGRATE